VGAFTTGAGRVVDVEGETVVVVDDPLRATSDSDCAPAGTATEAMTATAQTAAITRPRQRRGVEEWGSGECIGEVLKEMERSGSFAG
jgi:hypothetical protein